MSKGIIVVDVPENCGYCDFNALCGDGKHRCGVGSIEDIIDGYEDSIPDWCPIRPYDPDKIIKQLEESDKIIRVFPKLQPNLSPSCEHPYPLPKPKPVSLKPIKCIPLTEAIEIVEAGGAV